MRVSVWKQHVISVKVVEIACLHVRAHIHVINVCPRVLELPQGNRAVRGFGSCFRIPHTRLCVCEVSFGRCFRIPHVLQWHGDTVTTRHNIAQRNKGVCAYGMMYTGFVQATTARE
jgi:hypothetical protein